MADKRQGTGLLKVFGLLGLIMTTAIVAVVYVRQMETGVEAQQSAKQIKEDLEQVIREQKEAIEATRRQIELPGIR